MNKCALLVIASLFLLLPPSGYSSRHSAQKLLTLAQAEFSDLTLSEKGLLRAVANGELLNCKTGDEVVDNPLNAENWGPERTIRADVLRWLCVTPEAAACVDPLGIMATGVYIKAALKLDYATISFPLQIIDSFFPEQIALHGAHLPMLSLRGSRVMGISADGLRVERGLFFKAGFRAEGEVRLPGAVIGGNLECGGGAFVNPGGKALFAEGIEVRVSTFLNNGFRAEGEVNLIRAVIGGDLHCDGDTFVNPRGKALNAEGIEVGGCVFLRNGFRAEGEVNLIGAVIGGNLECTHGTFVNPGGKALNAEGVQVKNNIFFRGSLSGVGRIFVHGATVNGNFQWRPRTYPDSISLDMRYAKINVLFDDCSSYPKPDSLFLAGLTYEQFGGDAPYDARTRLKWLRLQSEKEFSTQPYQQLAQVLEKSGLDGEAKKVRIGMENDRRRFGKVAWYLRPLHLFLGIVAGYGHDPHRTGMTLVIIIALGTFLFCKAHRDNGILTLQEPVNGSGYPAFNAFMYSIDVFIPLIDFGLTSFWQPKGKYRWWYWFQVAMGWLLTTILVLHFTGFFS